MLNPALIRALIDDRERSIAAELRRRRMLDGRPIRWVHRSPARPAERR